MEKQFEKYLIEQGYKHTTPSGHPSTVYAYIKSINNVCEWENMTQIGLAENIKDIVRDYDIDGVKEKLGLKSHSTVINALKAYERFVDNINLSSINIKRSNHSQDKKICNILVKSLQIPKEYRKSFLMSNNMYYDILELYHDKVVGYFNKQKLITFPFSEYDTISFKSNKHGIFSEINFYKNINWNKTQAPQKYRSIREPEKSTIHTIRFYGGVFGRAETDQYAKMVANEIMDAYDDYMISQGL